MLLTPCVSISIPQMAGDGVVKWRGEDDRKVNIEHKIYIKYAPIGGGSFASTYYYRFLFVVTNRI